MVEVKLLHYTFQFRPLSWREEFAIRAGKEDPRKVTLATALESVSGLRISSPEEALKIIQTIPTSVFERAYIIYRYKLPKTRIFSTRDMYKAPAPLAYQKRVMDEEGALDDKADQVARQMEQTYGRAELAEQRALEAEILKKSDKRGAVKRDSLD